MIFFIIEFFFSRLINRYWATTVVTLNFLLTFVATEGFIKSTFFLLQNIDGLRVWLEDQFVPGSNFFLEGTAFNCAICPPPLFNSAFAIFT